MQLGSNISTIELEGVIKRNNVDPTIMFNFEDILRQILRDIPCTLDNTGEYNHTYLIMNDTDWKSLT